VVWEASPSPVYGARLLSGLRAQPSRGFKSRRLRHYDGQPFRATAWQIGSLGLYAPAVSERMYGPVFSPDHCRECGIRRGEGQLLRERKCSGETVGETGGAACPVVMPSPEPACHRSLIWRHWDNLHACIGQQGRVSVDVVRVTLIDPDQLVEYFCSIGPALSTVASCRRSATSSAPSLR
jgi:hypothetical protein